MSSHVYSVTRIVPQALARTAPYDVVRLTFAEAYAALRHICPTGDLRIHLSIEVDSAIAPAGWTTVHAEPAG